MLVLAIVIVYHGAQTQEKPEPAIPIRGFAIAAPKPTSVDRFVKFKDNHVSDLFIPYSVIVGHRNMEIQLSIKMKMYPNHQISALSFVYILNSIFLSPLTSGNSIYPRSFEYLKTH